MEQETLLKKEDTQALDFQKMLNEAMGNFKTELETLKKENEDLKLKLLKEEPKEKVNILKATQAEIDQKTELDNEVNKRVEARAKILEFQNTKEKDLGEVAKNLLSKINNFVNLKETDKADYLDIVILVDKFKKDPNLKEYINDFDKPIFEEFEFILKNQSVDIFEFKKSQELLKAISIAESYKQKIEDKKKTENRVNNFLGGGSINQDLLNNYDSSLGNYLNLLKNGSIMKTKEV